MKTKPCTKCKVAKLLTDYFNFRASKNGKGSVCKECFKEYSKTNRSKPCKVPGCNGRPYHQDGYCGHHYYQVKKHGKILPGSTRDRNEISIDGDIAYLILKKGDQKVRARAIIDIEDVARIKDYKWHCTDQHVCGIVNGKPVTLPQFLIDPPKNKFVFHLNHNFLDNRKCNLRICNHQIQNVNRRLGSNNTSGIKGVTGYKSRNKWAAQLHKNGRHYFGGYHNDIEDALLARKKLENEHFKDLRLI